MANPKLPLPPQLLSEFDSVVLRMFESVDDANSRCVFGELTCPIFGTELTWLPTSRRFDSTRIAEAELELVNQIAALKRRHERRRNFSLCRIPAELLTRLLSFLSAKDQLSIIRVCQSLRHHVVDTPGLWTQVDRIQNPGALSFVLERTKSLAVDITSLSMTGEDDVRFDTLAVHMHCIRTLCLDFGQVNTRLWISSETRAYKAFATTAPLLQRLSMRADKAIESNSHPYIFWSSACSIPARAMPQLSTLQLRGINLGCNFYRQIQSLRSFSYSGRENTAYMGLAVAEHVSQQLCNLDTINLELDWWNADIGSLTLGPAVQQINIRWNKPGVFAPRDAVPTRTAWRSVRTIHVAHVHNSSDPPPDTTLNPSMFAIPETTAPYQILTIRTSGAANKRAHLRAFDSEDRERVFCGLHPATVVGMVARIPGESLSAITISATAVALRALSDARCPLLRNIRLVLDTDDIVWLDSFMLDVSKIRTLEQLEFSQGTGPETSKWTTAAVIRTMSCCVASGNRLQEILFLGFSPEAQCLAMAGMFSQQVTVDPNWREPKSERAWFTELPFEWF